MGSDRRCPVDDKRRRTAATGLRTTALLSLTAQHVAEYSYRRTSRQSISPVIDLSTAKIIRQGTNGQMPASKRERTTVPPVR